MPNPAITYLGGSEVRFHQALYLRPRQIESCRILYVESGSGEFIFPGKTFQIEDRTLLFLSPGPRESHYRDTKPVSYLYIEFKIDSPPIDLPYLHYPESAPHFQTIISLLRSTLKEPEVARHLIPAAIELATHVPAASRKAKTDKRIQRVIRFIELNLNCPMRVTDLAREVGMSEPQFRRVFCRDMGTSPKQYLLRERMNYAQRMLQSEGLRVGEVAELLQFETIYQFSNQYKKVHGHSPSQD